MQISLKSLSEKRWDPDWINATRFKLYNIIEATENLPDTCNYTVTVSNSESVLNDITTVDLVLSLITWYEALTFKTESVLYAKRNRI